MTAPFVGLLTLVVAWASGGLSPSLHNPDEGGHYVNALFLGDWIRAGFPSPMAFAQDFYAHFPRLSIGHWPPGWYMVQAPAFAVFRPSPFAALVASALVAGFPAVAILWASERIGQRWLGASLAFAYAFSPLVVEAARHILLDQPVALVVGSAAIAWFHASERPSWRAFLLFGLLAAAAPMVKGNGALVALIPALDIALTGRWRVLRHPGLWVAAALALVIVAPWYWLSFQISAGGFNYEPGLDYAWTAFAANAAAVRDNIGLAGIGLALLGLIAAVRADAARSRLAKLALSVVIATLLFQSLVPVAIEPRYISPLLPWLYVLAGLGIAALLDRRHGGIAALGAAALALVPAAANLSALSPKPDLRAPTLAGTMIGAGGIWLVDARAGGEGAVIAAAAHADGGRRRTWVARASQWLSTSDFMGRNYRLTATSPAAARAVLDRLGAKGVVSIIDRDLLAYPHSRVLTDAVRQGGYAITSARFAAGPGATALARRTAPVVARVDLLANGSGSANVGKMGAALN